MHGMSQTFGGSHLDRYLFDLETTPDGAADISGGDEAGAALPSPDAPVIAGAAGDEATPSDAATDTAPAWTPEQIHALRDHPEFQSFLADEAGAVARAQLQSILQEYAAQEQGGYREQEAGLGDIDFAEFLNPLEDNFGTNLAQFMAHSQQAAAQQILGAVQQMLSPILEERQEKLLGEGSQRIDDILADDVARNGDWNAAEQAPQLVKTLAPLFMRQAEARYGEGTPRAAEAALAHAASTVRQLDKAAHDKGFEAGKNWTQTLADGGRSEPGVGAAGAQTFPEATNLSEITQRYARNAQAIRTNAA